MKRALKAPNLAHSARQAGWLLLAGCWLSIGPAAAADQGDADPAVLNYPLTIEKVRHYSVAAHSLEAASQSDAALNDELQKMSDEPDSTLADLKQKISRHPRIFAFYRHEGLSLDDTVLLPLATANALAATEPAAPPSAQSDASPDQRHFAEEHREELKSLLDWGQSQD